MSTRAPRESRPFAKGGLFSRVPALERLAESGRRVPVIRQLSPTECGAACVAMVLAYHGRHVPLEEIRSASGVGRDGASASALVEAGRRFGLLGRGLRLEVDDLDLLPRGSILHWEFNHFVVFERMRKDAIEIVDPAFGARRIALAEVRRSFTGVALTFERTSDFAAERAPRSRFSRYADLLRGTGVLGRIVVLSAVLQLLALGAPLATSAIVDRVVPRHDASLLVVLGVGVLGMGLFHALAALVRGHLLVALRTHVDARLTLGLLDHLGSLPYAFSNGVRPVT